MGSDKRASVQGVIQTRAHRLPCHLQVGAGQGGDVTRLSRLPSPPQGHTLVSAYIEIITPLHPNHRLVTCALSNSSEQVVA